MICLTRLNGEAFALNPDLIERVEAHPDTVVTLTDDVRVLVRESVHDVLRAIRDYRADVLHGLRDGPRRLPGAGADPPSHGHRGPLGPGLPDPPGALTWTRQP